MRHFTEGLESEVYFNKYPWINQGGRAYAERRGFKISDTILQGHKLGKLNPPRRNPNRSRVRNLRARLRSIEVASSSSGRLGARARAVASAAQEAFRDQEGPKASSSGPAAAKRSPAPRLKPRTTTLPDTVLWFDRSTSTEDLERGHSPRAPSLKK